MRIATYYIWARLHRDGERGLAEGLALLTGLVERFGTQLLPSRPASRKMALEWLAGEKMLDSLARYPEVAKEDFANIVAALSQLTVSFTAWPEDQHSPSLMLLINALESRLAQSGGMNAVVPQNSSSVPAPSSPVDAPQVQTITSGRDLIDQAKVLARYLEKQSEYMKARIAKGKLDPAEQIAMMRIKGRQLKSDPDWRNRSGSILKKQYARRDILKNRVWERSPSIKSVSVELKTEAIRRMKNRKVVGEKVQDIADDLNVSISRLYHWLKM